MKKIDIILSFMVILVALAFAFVQFQLINFAEQTIGDKEHVERKVLFYEKRHEDDLAANKGLNEKNRELRGYNNFLESQNKMLMEKNKEND